MPSGTGTAPLENEVKVKVPTTECDMDAHNVEVARADVGVDGVEAWLAAMNIKVDLGRAQQTETIAAPATPALKPLRIQQYGAQLCEEISPTDTNFSSDPIFDSPYNPTDSSCISARPDTDASSLDDEDEVCARKELFASVELSDDSGVEPGTPTTILDTSSDSPPSLAPIAPTHALNGFDPHATHLIYLTSCLQCVLSGLPCSRTLPACSRCIRHGHGDLCLAQRKRHHSEIYCADDSVDTDPILLMREGDDEGTFHKKIQLQSELLNTWWEKRERKNWVIPADNGIRGDWKTAPMRKVELHPGVGSGPQKHYRLRVAMWHENARRGRVGR
ncbi:hypothetical protein P171DRAFT_483838 [Karstenula rhodostoma CBS 690.94]|uniref:Zn(2)-C6 fungal-type domain-containing protein n=1 Tax=Karstenula rhodostoma CBS 690.94 TaxID=1392251 RepID=A0A9P4PK09_9PLEO|nr:hypothetical protein P171DRAFT_483838 [Karstenula rhodostoma CBS 690.94]